MKTILHSILSSAFLSAFLFCRTAQADVIANWTFENYYQSNSVVGTDSAGLLPAGGPLGSTAWAHHASASSIYSDVTGNGSVHALSADHWAIGDFFEFQTATLGFTNLSISFDQFRSGTGPTDWNFEYSTDGSIFTTALFYTITNTPAWSSGTYRPAYTFTVDLSSVPALAGDASVYFRLVAASAAGGVAGASRVDNFILLGQPVPEPSVFVLAGLGGLWALVRWLKRQQTITKC